MRDCLHDTTWDDEPDEVNDLASALVVFISKCRAIDADREHPLPRTPLQKRSFRPPLSSKHFRLLR